MEVRALVPWILFNLLPSTLSSPVASVLNADCSKCHPVVDTKINVHLIPHSHDDVGWLKTVDQYYYGGHNNIQRAGVQYIISSVVEALKRNPDRRFIQVETAFLWMWWRQQTAEARRDFVDLVNGGQIEVVNGAWSMNDEADANYQSTIDQFTWGLRFLNETFGRCGQPRVGWQIDPFGHSREHASLLQQMGFSGLVFARLDFRDKARRVRDGAMELVWRGSASIENSGLFTYILPDHYSAPRGFCFDVTCTDDPIIDDVASPDFNLDKKVKAFADRMETWARAYKTNNILVTMGDDFQFQAAEMNYINMDRLIKGFANHDKLNVIYSTPSCFLRAVSAAATKKPVEFETKTDDFLPYASDAHSFWTGYYTSRPNSKRFERTGNNILQSAKQLAAFAQVNGGRFDGALDDLRQSMGIMQHHDAITGTEKQAVADDYTRILTEAIEKAEEPLAGAVSDLLGKDGSARLALNTCLLANVSVCEATAANRFVVAIYNPLSRPVSHFVRLPVGVGAYIVTGQDGAEPNDVLEPLSDFDFMPASVKRNPRELVFEARDVPPLGVKLYHVERAQGGPSAQSEAEANDDAFFGTDETHFELDPQTKLLKSVTMNGKSVEMTQEFLYYKGSNGDDSRASGAYVFRPANNTSAYGFGEPVAASARRGLLVDEVKQRISHRLTQVIRVYKSRSGPNNFIEFDWLVGDLEACANKTGTEVISRFTVKEFDNNSTFYTDSNGREQIKRVLGKRADYAYNATEEPISSNYYPVTSRMVIVDEARQLEVAVLSDRAQGGSSLGNGMLELMVHRRLLKDDGFGVNEPLDEKEFGMGVYVRGQHHLVLGPSGPSPNPALLAPLFSGKSTAAQERLLAQQKLLAPWILVGGAPSLADFERLFNFQFSGLQQPLPDNVHILTLEPWRDGSLLLRLEHIFEKGEDVVLSRPVTVSLRDLFASFEITNVKETTLGANEWLDEFANKEKFVWMPIVKQPRTASENDHLEISLKPMQIRTFIIEVKSNKNANAASTLNSASFLCLLFVLLLSKFV